MVFRHRRPKGRPHKSKFGQNSEEFPNKWQSTGRLPADYLQGESRNYGNAATRKGAHQTTPLRK